MFDPDTNKWTAIPDMKEAHNCCAACAIDDKLYVIDHQVCSSIEVFETATKKWSLIPNMTNKRIGCAAVSVGDKIYFFGGCSTDYDNTLSSAQVYDVTTQEGTQLPQMKEKRYMCTATAVGITIYIVGGQDDNSIYLLSCERFDITTNSWSSPIPHMKERKWNCQAVSIDSKIFIIGDKNNHTTFSSLEVLETRTNKLIPPQEENERMKNCSDLLEAETNDGNDIPMNDSNDDAQSTTRSAILTDLSTCKNDPTNSSFMTVNQRVLLMEESVGLKHDPSALLIRRIEFLERNICGENQELGKPLIERVDNLEASFFRKKRKITRFSLELV